MDNICCNCANLQTYVESVAPGEGMIIHRCKITNCEVKWNGGCNTGAFVRKK